MTNFVDFETFYVVGKIQNLNNNVFLEMVITYSVYKVLDIFSK